MSSYERHIKTMDEPTKCNLCNFKSCTNIGMRYHKLKIHGEKTQKIRSDCFKCNHKHAAIYIKTEGEPRKCNVCDFMSCTKLGMTLHRRKSHDMEPEKNQFVCSKCNQKLKSRGAIKAHMKTRYQPKQCDLCVFDNT